MFIEWKYKKSWWLINFNGFCLYILMNLKELKVNDIGPTNLNSSTVHSTQG